MRKLFAALSLLLAYSLPAHATGYVADHCLKVKATVSDAPIAIDCGGVPVLTSNIGSTVQAWDTDLDAFAGLSGASDKLAYFTGAHTMATTTLTSFGRSLIDDTDAASGRTTLGLVIGTDVQAYDGDLAAIAALSSTGLVKRTGTNTWAFAAAGTDYAPATSGSTALLGNGSGGFSNYAGASCTNQFLRSLSAALSGTCATVANADLANSSITLNTHAVSLGGSLTLGFSDLSGTIASGQVSGSYSSITGVGTVTAGTWNATAIADGYIASASAWNAKLGTGAIGVSVQAYSVDLSDIAGLSPSNDDIVQRKSGHWTNRTLSQLGADMVAANVGGAWGDPIASWTWSTNVSQVDFTGLSGYRDLLIVGYGLTHNSGSTQNLMLRTSTDNGSSFATTSYVNYANSALTDELQLSSSASGTTFGFETRIINFNSSSYRSLFTSTLFQLNVTAGARVGWGYRDVVEAHNALRFLFSGGSIASGTILVFGRK